MDGNTAPRIIQVVNKFGVRRAISRLIQPFNAEPSDRRSAAPGTPRRDASAVFTRLILT
jgi:hypothetical protein